MRLVDNNHVRDVVYLAVSEILSAIHDPRLRKVRRTRRKYGAAERVRIVRKLGAVRLTKAESSYFPCVIVSPYRYATGAAGSRGPGRKDSATGGIVIVVGPRRTNDKTCARRFKNTRAPIV